MGHALERGPRYRIGLGGDRHPLIISDGRRIVHEHTASVAAEGKNPMWSSPGHHVIARNEDDDHAPGSERAHENRFAYRSQVGGDTERLRLTLESELGEAHDAALGGGLCGVEKIGAGLADIDLRLEPAALERDRHPVWLAPARSRCHEDRGRFAPKLKLEGGLRLEIPLGPGE